ncbi:MAG: hypothetical protein NTZ49_05610 [Candidatus Parcubacteria bacterium]|nr:hypothetical protein [Candidatus Parcubacteria bacterium]
MLDKNARILLVVALVVIIVGFFVINHTVLMAEEDPCRKYDTKITVSARNEKGEFIPDVSFSIYTQVADVYGNPKPDILLATAKVSPYTGKGQVTLKKSGPFALKIFHKNSAVGVFWFYNELNIICGESRELSESLSGINFILRDGEGNLKKDTKFKVYTQRQDVDGNPIREKEDLVGEFDTSSEGNAIIYVSEKTRSVDGKGVSYYMMESEIPGNSFKHWGVKVNLNKTTIVNYNFSDLIAEFINANGTRLMQKDIDLYSTDLNLKGEYILGKKLTTAKTDNNGLVLFEYPTGSYALSLQDSLKSDSPFWGINIPEQHRSRYSLKVNNTRALIEGFGAIKPVLNIYALNTDVNGFQYRGTKLTTFNFPQGGQYLDMQLKPAPYLFTIILGTKEYGNAFYADNDKFQEILIKNDKLYEVLPMQRFSMEIPPADRPGGATSNVVDKALVSRLKGYILLQVEANGEAWYVDPKTEKRYYMRNGEVAYEAMRKFGVGISTNDLQKIPIGLDDRLQEIDTDGDGLFDKLEDGLGTDRLIKDTDEDGFDDGVEIKSGYDPLAGSGKKLVYDLTFAANQKGKILLQVEAHGEAWYVNPKDGKRYYMKDGASAYEIMRFLSLGIKNSDLAKIPIGSFQ